MLPLGMLTSFFYLVACTLSLLHAKPLTNDPTYPLFTTPHGCEYEGKFYFPGEHFGEGSDGKGWCYGRYCDYDGNVQHWDDFNCGTTTTPDSTTQKITDPPTTIPPQMGCEYEGKFYGLGEEISSGIDKDSNWCFGTYCGEDGSVVAWDNFECFTTTVSTTLPATTPPVTRPQGCEYEGKLYALGEKIREETDGEGWCRSLYCDSAGNLVPGDDFECGKITPTITTQPSNKRNSGTTAPKFFATLNTILNGKGFTKTTAKQTSCEYEGKFYAAGEVLDEVSDDNGLCYGLYCDNDGNLVPWYEVKCGTTTPPITTPGSTTTKSSPSQNTIPNTKHLPKPQEQTSSSTGTYPPFTTPPGCEYEGRFYAPGEKFGEGSDGKGWCYGLYCDHNGNVVPWDNFNCDNITPTTPFMSTLPDSTTQKSSTTRNAISNRKISSNAPSHTLSSSKSFPKTATKHTGSPRITDPSFVGANGCEYEGKRYAPGEEFGEGSDGEGWCYGLYCSDDGNVVPWSNFNCDPTNPSITTIPDSTIEKSSALRSAIPVSKSSSKTTKQSSSSPPDTHLPSTSPSGCEYEGKFYSPGEQIREWRDGRECHGLYCDSDGNLVPWDDFNCATSTPLLRTTVPSLSTTIPKKQSTKNASPTSKPNLSSTTSPVGLCYFKGSYYENGEIISRVHHGWSWCSGFFCNDGKVDSWSDIDCANPTTVPSDVQSKATCTYQGSDYQDGELVNTLDGSGGCTSLYCKNGLLVAEESMECESSTATNAHTIKISVFSTNAPIRKTNEMKEIMSSTTVEVNSSTKESKPFTTEDSLLRKTTQIMKTNPFAKEVISSIPVKSKLPVRKETSSTTTADANTYTMRPTNPPTSVKTKTPFRKMNDVTTTQDSLTNAQGIQPTIKTHLFATQTNKMSTDASNSFSTTSEQTTTPEIATHSTTHGIDITKPPELCFHQDRHYEEGDIISRDFDGNNWCSGWTCKGGRLIPVDCGDITAPLSKVSSPTPEFAKVFPSLGPEPLRCFHNGRYYEEGDMAPSDFDGEILCSGLLCQGGNMVPWDDCSREETKPTSIPTSHAIPTSTPEIPVIPTKTPDTTSIPPSQTTEPEKQECFYEGKYYPPGVVTRGILGNGRCYGVICDISGAIFRWNATCAPREQPTAAMKATLPGCVHGDKYYPPGRISRVSDGSDWCLEVICTKEGKITPVNRLDCNEATTTKPTTSATTQPEGKTCLYNGMEHYPGVISEGVDGDGWCYKVVCRDNGQLHLWGSWQCKQKLATTTPPPTTPSSAKLCSYSGRKYPVGEITRGVEPSGWCYGVICKQDGQIMLWGSFKCAKV